MELEQQKQLYSVWKWKIFCILFAVCLGNSFNRKTLSYAMPGLIQNLNYDLSQMGILSSVYSVAFAGAKLIGGIAADHYSSKILITFGIFFSGVSNLLFGVSSTLKIFIPLWGLNGICQGLSWPPVAKSLTSWYPTEERGTWWAVVSTATTLGGAMIAFGGSAITEYFGWRTTMLVPGIYSMFVGVVVYCFLLNSPQEAGITSLEGLGTQQSKEKNVESTRDILFKYVLNNRHMWFISIAFFLQYVVKQAISDWGLLFLVETKQFSTITAGSCMVFFELAGMGGVICAGVFSDKFCKGNRGPINLLFTAAVGVGFSLLWCVQTDNYWVNSLIFLMIGFFMYGPHTLLGVTAAELAHKRATGTALGITGAAAGLGGSMAGYPLAWVTQHYGWNGFVLVLIVTSFLGALSLAPLWSVKRPKEE